MKNWLLYSLLIFCLLALTTPVYAQDAIPKDEIVFAASMEHAKMEAKERNCPIFAFIHMDGN